MPNIRRGMMAAAGAGAAGGHVNTPFTAYYYLGWGRNTSGQLGQGNTTIFSSPVQIGGKLYRAFAMGASGYPGAGNTGAVDTDGKLFTCGNAADGALGDGTTTDKSSPVQIGSATDWGMVATAGAGPGRNYTTAAKTDGTLWSWGNNENGCLGQNNLTDICSPVQIGSLTDWRAIGSDGNIAKSRYAIKSDGTIWCWGYGGKANSEGSLGLGAQTTSYSSPVQIGSLTDWGDGEFSIENNQRMGAGVGQMNVIKSDGTMWGWGQNDKGQLSDGSKIARNSPVQAVGGGTAWNIFCTNDESVCAIDTDGKLWSWGRNSDGQLGLGNTTYYSSPQQIGSATDWVLVSGLRDHRAAINSSGVLYTWAGNRDGSLGLGDITNRCVPTQVGSLTDWKYINFSTSAGTAVKTDGTGWAWGVHRETPFESDVSYSSPVQIGTRTDYTWASAFSAGGLIASSATI